MYYIYVLTEKVNNIGKPYIGMTDNVSVRSLKWKRVLGLDYKPTLKLVEIFYDEDECWEKEQLLRVSHGWSREKQRYSNNITRAKKGGINNSMISGNLHKARQRAKEILSIPIIQCYKNTTISINEWNSQHEASKELNIKVGNINKCLKGERPNAGGFSWIYKPIE